MNPKPNPSSDRMPVLFVGHGNPMNAVEENRFTRAWIEQAKTLPKPSAILCVSAHWFIGKTLVHGGAKPKTIHDFYGFPRELYEIRYGCPGAPGFAQQVRSLIRKAKIGLDQDWGLDHGAWVPLMRLFPTADIPTFQLSIDFTKPSAFHYDLGKELAPLRHEGVLIVCSGNFVHNLGVMRFERDSDPFPWADNSDQLIKSLILEDDHRSLIHYEKLGKEVQLSIPTPDHYWPLLYALGLKEKGDSVALFAEGIAHASISMASVRIG